MTVISAPTPNGGASNPDVTAYDEGLPLPNGAAVASIGVYSEVAQAGSVKVVRKVSASGAEIVFSHDFAHAGAGWHDVPVSFVVPSVGPHFLGSWLAGSAKTNGDRARRYHYAAGWGNRGVGTYTGWDGDVGPLRAMRASYSGGGGPQPGDGVWRTKQVAGGLSYYERAVGTPSRIIFFHPAWDDDYTQMDAFKAQFEAAPNCVVVSAGEPTNSGPNAGAGPVQLGKLKAVIDAVKAQWGSLPVDVVAASGGVPVVVNFMAAYPGSVRRASLWVGPYDFVAWWNDNTGFRSDLQTVCGGAPSTAFAEYAKRSPRWTMDNITSLDRVTINSRSGDSVVPKHHQERMHARFKGLATVANFNSLQGDHAFTTDNCATAIGQIS